VGAAPGEVRGDPPEEGGQRETAAASGGAPGSGGCWWGWGWAWGCWGCWWGLGGRLLGLGLGLLVVFAGLDDGPDHGGVAGGGVVDNGLGLGEGLEAVRRVETPVLLVVFLLPVVRGGEGVPVGVVEAVIRGGQVVVEVLGGGGGSALEEGNGDWQGRSGDGKGLGNGKREGKGKRAREEARRHGSGVRGLLHLCLGWWSLMTGLK
jgi:hypothetical protein